VRGSAPRSGIGPVAAVFYPRSGLLEDARVRASRQLVPEPIPAPLLHVSVHVVKAPGVRGLLADLVGHAVGVFLVPSILLQLSLVIAEGESGRRAGAAGILPLGLRRQSIFPLGWQTAFLSLAFGELATELAHLVVVDEVHRKARAFARQRHV